MKPQPSQILANAEIYRKSMEAELDKINHRIALKLREDYAHFVYQGGDGWCICYADGRNALINGEDLNQLFTMKKKEALAFLEERRI